MIGLRISEETPKKQLNKSGVALDILRHRNGFRPTHRLERNSYTLAQKSLGLERSFSGPGRSRFERHRIL